MNCLSDLKFPSPAFTLIRVHPRHPRFKNLPGIPLRPTASSSSLRSLHSLRLCIPLFSPGTRSPQIPDPGTRNSLPCQQFSSQTPPTYPGTLPGPFLQPPYSQCFTKNHPRPERSISAPKRSKTVKNGHETVKIPSKLVKNRPQLVTISRRPMPQSLRTGRRSPRR